MRVNVVVLVEESFQEHSCISVANDLGKSCKYFIVLNCASENGLSFDTLGRECDRTMPRLVSSSGTNPEVIEVPRSASTECGTVPLRQIASSMNSVSSSELSCAATIHDGVVSGVGVDDYVEVKPDPFGGSAEFGDVSCPDL